MFQNHQDGTAIERAARRVLGALAVIVALSAASGAVSAGEPKPPKRVPPGVIIEPPKPRGDAEVIRPDGTGPEDGPQQRPGCPANDRKLELIV